MRNLALAFFIVLATALAGYASDCQNVTFDNYIPSGFSCGVMGSTYSNFNYNYSSNPPGYGLPPSSIMVDPIFDSVHPGLEFSGGWFASTSSGIQEQDSLFQFTVTSPSPISELSLAISGVGFLGTGSVTVDEVVCLGAMLPECSGGTVATLHVYDSSSGEELYDSINFTGVNLIDIDKDVMVQAGTDGSAELSLVTNQFSASVPEPGTLSMMGFGIVALAGFARRMLNL